MRRCCAVALGYWLAAGTVAAGSLLSRADITTPAPLPDGSLLIVGFLGGWEDWDHPKRSVRKLALKLKDSLGEGVYVETAGNRSRRTVRNFIREALDRNSDGVLQADEAAAAQIICYGQSLGGSACVHLARDLERWNVPVRLTVQIDSVGRRDDVIPGNVKRAVNLYQADPGPIRGCREIRAADPSRTRILANLRHTYLFRDIDMADYPAPARLLKLSHFKMDSDPLVWAEVEAFIRAEILLWRALGN
ncbi:MAG: hypothetical protein IPM24_20660 [Bryobacterales bacterium]|nr:hypothetical protein [Bryobacterales bacterium]